MAFNQKTVCVSPSNYTTMDKYIKATIIALTGAGIGALIAGAAGMPWCIPFALTIGASLWLIAYCEWWLYGRLICLGGDFTAIGMLVSVAPPGNKSFPDSLDTDYSINLLLPKNPPGVTQAAAEMEPPFGFLIKEQDSTKNIPVPFLGEFATDQATGAKSAVLHCEFEGNGVYDTLIGAQISLPLSVASLIACLAIPPPWGLIVAGILAFLAFLAMLLGLLIGLGDEGDPADVNPTMGELHTNDAAKGGIGADLLVVSGTWVYDSAHEGWNELHPIKLCEKVGTWEGDWPADIDDIITHWTTAVKDATSPQTESDQKDPEHGWGVHPELDGCGGAPPPVP